VSSGLYVTELIGFGVNLVTGDYSRGAAGLWIEGGELGQPVEEVTIAGNLRDMLAGIEMVGSDLVFRGATSAPTIKVGRMTVAGACAARSLVLVLLLVIVVVPIVVVVLVLEVDVVLVDLVVVLDVVVLVAQGSRAQ
jgi:hypothetical protein